MNNYKKIEKARKLLEENGFQVENLWCVDDVKSKFKCTDEEAKTVLKKALINDATMEQIWLAIDIVGENEGLKKK
jgi:muramoyltetrapeptide carboxypeptidase LdcA involved in peptidoglycan recycling